MRRHDMQKLRVYHAEAVAFPLLWRDPVISLNQASAYVRAILARKAVQRLVGHLPPWVTVDPKREGRGASGWATPGRMRITIQPSQCRRILLVHELAHLFAGKQDGDWHGREFCRVYLLLVRNVFGRAHHDALRAAFRKHAVKYKRRRRVVGTGNVAFLQRWKAQQQEECA